MSNLIRSFLIIFDIYLQSFLHEMLRLSYQQKSAFYPLIACRMVRLSFSHGLCKYSATGLASMALSLLAVFKDFDGKISVLKLDCYYSPVLTPILIFTFKRDTT